MGRRRTATRARRLAARDTVTYIDGRHPGRVKQQLRQLSRLLETLLTSKLETHR